MGATGAKLENEIAANPEAGDVIPGLGGARKIRFAMRGKRGGGRAIYVAVVLRDTAYLLLAYAKGDPVDLSNDQRDAIRELVKELSDGQD